MGHAVQRYYQHKEPRANVRFTAQEWDRVSRIQATVGMSVPALLKKALLDRVDLERPLFSKEEARAILAEMNRWGNNLNQIAKRVNGGERFGMNTSFNALARGLYEIRRLILVGNGNNKD